MAGWAAWQHPARLPPASPPSRPPARPPPAKQVKESFLHRIPGLAEHFVYCNDDVLLGRPLPKAALFSPERPGVGVTFLTEWPWLAPEPSNEVEVWKYPFWNAAKLFEGRFGRFPLESWHAGYALSRAAYRAAWALFGAELNATSTHRFRDYRPLAAGGSIVSHVLVMNVGVELGLLELHRAQVGGAPSRGAGAGAGSGASSGRHAPALLPCGMWPAGIQRRSLGRPSTLFLLHSSLPASIPRLQRPSAHARPPCLLLTAACCRT